MNSDEKALMRILFQNRIYSSNGQQFEDLFTAVMQAANPNFKQIKPQGPIGDRKNDGFDTAEGSYYQVYAPEEPKESEGAAVSKLKTDFAGLKSHWDKISQVKQFRFAFNDKYSGSFFTIEDDLAALKKAHSLTECSSFLAKDLEDTFFKLTDDQMKAIIGFIPDPGRVEVVDFTILGQVIAEILRHKIVLDVSQIYSAPDLDEKIKFNGLGAQVGTLLNSGGFHAGTVEKYFQLNSTFTKQEIRNHLNDLYRRFVAQRIPVAKGSNPADAIFFQILTTITPSPTTREKQDVALIIMSYFFEACDIFEDPSSKVS